MNLTIQRPECIALLCNPNAGKGRASTLLGHISNTLRDRSISFESFSKQWPPDLGHFSTAWIVGGDGTLNYFINHYPNPGVPIALFKGGSGNDFAWKLYGDKSTSAYLELAIEGRHQKVDGGICNGKYFLNGVGIGFDGEVVKEMGNKKRLAAGHLGYLLTVLRRIFFYREKVLGIQTENLERIENIFMLTIANGSRYGGGFLVAPQAMINDGELDFVLIRKIPVLLRLWYLPKMERGRHLGLSFVESSRERRIIVSSKYQIQAHLDGESMESNLFEISVVPELFSFIY